MIAHTPTLPVKCLLKWPGRCEEKTPVDCWFGVFLLDYNNLWIIERMWFSQTCLKHAYICGTRSVVNCGWLRVPLTFVSAGMGEDDLDVMYWSCDEEMNPESWEDMLESRAGVCCGSVELRYRWRGWWWWKRWFEEEEEEEEEGEWEWEPLDPLESLLLTLFRLL